MQQEKQPYAEVYHVECIIYATRWEEDFMTKL